MEILLNTIAIEPNRWTEGRVPHFKLVDLLEAVAGAGFKALEVWQNHAATLDRGELAALKRRLDELGMRAPILGMYPAFELEGAEREQELARWDQMFGLAEMFGSGCIKAMPGRTPSAQMTPELWRRSVEFVQEVLRRSREPGTVVTLETHAGTLADDPGVLLRFIEEVGSPRLKVCWQPFDFSDTEAAIALYDRLAPHVVHVHLQGHRGQEMAPLEHSDVDYRRVLPHMLQRGFDGYLSIEFVPECVVDSPEQFDLDRVLANARRDREFVESVLAGAA